MVLGMVPMTLRCVYHTTITMVVMVITVMGSLWGVIKVLITGS